MANVNVQSMEDQLDDSTSRLRVAKACTRCRTRKDRCDGLRPSCTNCATSSQPCVYEATTKKRGLPEGYVRSLEKLITLASQTVDGLDQVLLNCLQDEEVKRKWNTTTGEELYSTWKESRIWQELEKFLQSNTIIGSKRKRTVDDEAEEGSESSSWESVLDNLRQQAQQALIAKDNQPLSTVATSDLSLSQRATSRPNIFPVNSKILLDTYFSYVHSWYPILNRPTTLKAFYQYLRQPTAHKSDGNQALLWAIFAYTSMIINGGDPSNQNLSKQYAEIAISHIPAPSRNDEDVFDFDIGHAQALLILSVLRLGHGQWLGSWNSTGRATRILLALRHKNALDQVDIYTRGHHESENDIRAALQGSFIIETLLNVHFQNAHSLFDVSLLSNMMEEDGHDEWNSWTAATGNPGSRQEPAMILSVFNRLTRTFLVLAEVLASPGQNTDPGYIQTQLEKVHNLAQEHFASGISSPSQDSPPHHVFFQIGLLFAQLRLVSCVPENQRTHFELIPLSNNVLGLFDICARASYMDLHHIPPLYADILVLASEVAHGANSTATSPIYMNFSSTMLNFRIQLSDVWRSFRRPEVHRNSSQSQSQYVVTPEIPGLGLQRNASVNLPTASWGSSNGIATGSSFTAPFGDVRHSVPNIYGFPMPGTPSFSPSFSQGDDTDAIFHEMAHLDTNDWANDRALGFREFGFNDESAFLEFCNDPQRLAVNMDGMEQGQLSSTRQSWTFAGINNNT